jgi:hypothetical protein
MRTLAFNAIKVSQCLIEQYAMKTQGGVEVQLNLFLVWKPDGGEWSTSHPSSARCKLVDPTTALEKRKIIFSSRETKKDYTVIQPVA